MVGQAVIFALLLSRILAPPSCTYVPILDSHSDMAGLVKDHMVFLNNRIFDSRTAKEIPNPHWLFGYREGHYLVRYGSDSEPGQPPQEVSWYQNLKLVRSIRCRRVGRTAGPDTFIVGEPEVNGKTLDGWWLFRKGYDPVPYVTDPGMETTLAVTGTAYVVPDPDHEDEYHFFLEPDGTQHDYPIPRGYKSFKGKLLQDGSIVGFADDGKVQVPCAYVGGKFIYEPISTQAEYPEEKAKYGIENQLEGHLPHFWVGSTRVVTDMSNFQMQSRNYVTIYGGSQHFRLDKICKNLPAKLRDLYVIDILGNEILVSAILEGEEKEHGSFVEDTPIHYGVIHLNE